MKPRTIAVLALIAVAAVIAASLALRSDKASSSEPAPAATASLFADLPSRVNDVASVTVKTATAESTVELADGQWRLKEKSGYPVDAAKVREVILSLAALKNFEPRTTRAEGYKALGVEDVRKSDTPPPPDAKPPAEPPADAPRSTLLSLSDKAGHSVASVIVGNTKYPSSSGIAGGGGTQGVYLRRPGDAASYLAEGKLEVPREPLNWLNAEFVDIARDRVRSVTLTPPDNADADRILVSREKPGEGTFVVQNIPAGKQLKDTSLSEVLAGGLVKTTFEDVTKTDAIDFSGAAGSKPGPTAEVRTWDGLMVRVQTVQVGDKWWWKLTPAADPDPYKEAPPAPPPPPAPAPAADGSSPPAPAPAAPAEPKPRRTPEEVRKEVDDLATRWSGWVFAPFSYKSSAFSRKFSDELKDPTPPTAAPAQPPVAPAPVPPSPAP